MGSALHMRLVLYGTIVVIAGIVFAIRATAEPSVQPSKALFHGQTKEKLLVAMTVEDGRAGSAYMRWRMPCHGGPEPRILTLRFGKQFGSRFTQRGAAFSFEGRRDRPGPRGTATHYDIDFSGRISEDGRTIRGRGQVTHVESRDGQVVDTCRSQDVRWNAYRGPTSN
jgi:hypothetical protein